MRSKIIFISDIHLRGLDDARERAFLHFLREQETSLSRLVIAGDLFDFWIGYPNVIYARYFPALHCLYELREKGIEIDYIEGNHDFHLGPFFKDFLKCNVYPNGATLQIGEYRVSVSHGDLVNKKDTGNRILRFFLRSLFTKCAVRFVPPHWLWKIGCGASRLSHSRNHRYERTEALYARFAENQLRSSDTDILILGHSHTPDEKIFRFEESGKKDSFKYYFNTGDWVTHFTYVEYDPHESKKFSLRRFIFDTQEH